MSTPQPSRSSSLPTPPLPKARARSNHRSNNHRIFNRFPTLVFRPLATPTFLSISTLSKNIRGIPPIRPISEHSLRIASLRKNHRGVGRSPVPTPCSALPPRRVPNPPAHCSTRLAVTEWPHWRKHRRPCRCLSKQNGHRAERV